MGNCGSNPKTNEGPVSVPVTEEVKVEQKESATNVETNTEETPMSLGTLLNEKTEETPEKEEVKVEPKTEVEKAEPKAEEATAEPKPEEPRAQE